MNVPNFPTVANFKRAKMLVVEDNNDQWIIMQAAIQQHLKEVMIARVATVQQVITLLKEWEQQAWEIPKLILLDLYMPEKVDGWQLISVIKSKSEPIRRVPIVVLSSSNDPIDILKSYNLGIAAYLMKPIEPKDWPPFFQELRSYWWETVTLPPL
jgi:CheY-like chemotaxis protein